MQQLAALGLVYALCGAVIGLLLWAKAPTGRLAYERLLVNAILWPYLITGKLLR